MDEQEKITEEAIGYDKENKPPQYTRFNDSRRAKKWERISDGETAKFLNVVLEYFENRCALSGERFVKFDETIIAEDEENGKGTKLKSNLSGEHMIPLCIGGDDIVPNLLPTVYQYNIQKNGYYPIDYWKKAKDINGKSIFNPYRLLKVINYMMKSSSEEAREAVREGNIEKFKKIILTPNEIDKFIQGIDKNNLISETVTDTKLDKDNKKILKALPALEKNIPSQDEQEKMKVKQDEIKMMDIFLNDAIEEISKEIGNEEVTKEDGRKTTITEQLKEMYKEIRGNIPFEVKVRNEILNQLKELGVKENLGSVANELLINTEILELVNKEQTKEKIREIVKEDINKRYEELKEKVGEEKINEIIETSPEVLFRKENVEMYIEIVLPKYQKRLKELEIDGKLIQETDEQNINAAMYIMEKYNFEENIGRKLTKGEEKAIIEKLIGLNILNKEGTSYISTLYCKLKGVELEEQEICGAIINYAIGNGNGLYQYALNGKIKYKKENKNEIKTEIKEKDINKFVMEQKNLEYKGKIEEDKLEYQKRVKELEIDEKTISKKDEKNINAAMYIMEKYNFEENIGRKLTKEEEKAIIQNLIGYKILDKEGTSYISTLYCKLKGVELEEQEICGAIINYAIENGNENYSDALDGTIKYTKENKNEIKTKIIEEDIIKFIMENDKQEYKERLKELEIDEAIINKKDEKNVNTAMYIMERYNFEENIGRKLTKEEEKTIIETLIGLNILNKKGSVYISVLYGKLKEIGIEGQEIYGAIINYAIGNGDYSKALGGTIKYTKENKNEIKTKIREEDINQVIMEKDKTEYKEKLKELKIDEKLIQETDEKNINAAMYIMEKYNFEENIGRKLTKEEEKAIIEKLIGQVVLNKGKGCNYISTLHGKLKEVELKEQEICGAIINYAIGDGNGGYRFALNGTIKYTKKTKNEIKTEIKEEDINKFIMEQKKLEYKGKIEEAKLEYAEKLKELKIDEETISKIDEKNINAAMYIMKKYNFEENIGRKLTNEEEKAIIEKLIGQGKMNKGKGCCYISTLYGKLKEVELEEQEICGVIINYAIGNGNYSKALGGEIKYTKENKNEIKTEIKEEDINKFIMEQKKLEYRGKIEEAKLEYEEKLKELEIDGKLIQETDEKNINVAMYIMEKYNFEENIGRKLTKGEERAIIEKLIGLNILNKEGTSYISTLYCKLKGVELEEQESCGAIINYAIGNGNYSKALSGRIKYTKETRNEIKTEIKEEDIQRFMKKQKNKTNGKGQTRKATIEQKEKGNLKKNEDIDIELNEEYSIIEKREDKERKEENKHGENSEERGDE